MNNIHHEDFEKILNVVKHQLMDTVEFEKIRSLESNFDSKGLMYKSRRSSLSDGTIIVGEDNGLIAVDISKADGEVVSFSLKDIDDKDGIENIVNWLSQNYK